MVSFFGNKRIFASTVLTALPIGTVSQGESFILYGSSVLLQFVDPGNHFSNRLNDLLIKYLNA